MAYVDATHSANWCKRVQCHGRVPGFPFDEGFPYMYVGKVYELILLDGKSVEAIVADDTQYRAEGLYWHTGNGPVRGHNVAAWCQIDPPPSDHPPKRMPSIS